MDRTRSIVLRLALAGLVLLVFTAGAYAQNSLGRIAILPFSGGTTDEQEGIPELFMTFQEMRGSFGMIPRTGITNAARQEQSFQATSGMTDAETIARLGEQFGADYVMAGSITSLGRQNLLIVTIVKIDTIRQVGGVYLIYDTLDELNQDESILRGMAGELVEMTRSAAGGLERLALLPVELSGGGNRQEGDALAQILAIHLLNAGGYAVYPRTGNLEQVQKEYTTQLEGGLTRESEAVQAGQAENPPYVLSVISRKIGTGTRFNASIIDLESGLSIAGDSEQYVSMGDGITAMEFLAMKLSGIEISAQERARRERVVGSEERAREAENRSVRQQAAWDNFLKSSGIGFGGWLGGNVTNAGPKESKVTKEGKVMESTPSKFSGGADVELRIKSYFGIQTGITGITDYASYTPSGGTEQYAKLTVIQIPILARFNFEMEGIGWNFSPFIGLGVNTGLSSYAESVKPPVMSFITGFETGIGSNGFRLFFHYRFSGGLGKGSVTVDSVPYDYRQTSHIVSGGGRFYFPFRK